MKGVEVSAQLLGAVGGGGWGRVVIFWTTSLFLWTKARHVGGEGGGHGNCGRWGGGCSGGGVGVWVAREGRGAVGGRAGGCAGGGGCVKGVDGVKAVRAVGGVARVVVLGQQ